MSSARKFRVLMLHNAYQVRGGEEESAESEVRVLRDAGHHVTYLTAHNDSLRTRRAAASAAVAAVWNPMWHRKVAQHLAEERFDVLHVQNMFPQISPSVYYAARKAKVPVLQAVRNYRFACPSATMLREGAPCSDCVGRVIKTPGMRHACYRQSRLASATVAAVSGAHKVMGTWRSCVDRYVAISTYVADVLQQDGFPAHKISVKPCFAYQEHFATEELPRDDQLALFVGRLSPEKGVPQLLEAWSRLNLPNAKLHIIGEGTLPRTGGPSVEFLGRLSSVEVQKAMAQAAFVVMPGTWAEPFGRVAVEAFSQSTPVIASDVGGVASTVLHDVTGQQVPRNDPTTLAHAMRRYLLDPSLAQAHGRTARQHYVDRYSPAANLSMIESIYEEITVPTP